MNPICVEVPPSPVSGYCVHVGSGLLSQVAELISRLEPRPSGPIVVIADERIVNPYGNALLENLSRYNFVPVLHPVASGEGSKSMANLGPILSCLAQHRCDRSSVLVALGGGVVGDLAGFAAAVYQRGVRLVQIPTTLLAMVDSSVGGKTGVNLPEGKNLVGSFHQPSLVIADLDTLGTLPSRELSAGMAEVIKYGCIAEAGLFSEVEKGIPSDLAHIVRQCVTIKAQVVRQDPHELNGRRAMLNFGHTIGHAIENAAGYGTLLHGEAVAVGMRAAAHLSHQKSGLSQNEINRIERAISASGLPLTVSSLDLEKVRSALKLDKKVVSGRNRWVLLTRIGASELREDVSAEEIEAALRIIGQAASSV